MIDSLDRQTKRFLFSLPSVIGIGHGIKEVRGVQTNSEALMILVRKKVPLHLLNRNQLVPSSISGIITDVIEVGNLVAHGPDEHESSETNPGNELPDPRKSGEINDANPQDFPDLEDVFYSRTSRIRPAIPGVSIGHYLVTAGTFGAVVYDDLGQVYILSNNHILANSSNGTDLRSKIGDPVLQPGVIDGGSQNSNIIAKLYKYVALADTKVNQVDCAIAKPLQPDLIKPEILGIGGVQGVAAQSLGAEVKKSGRTTGVTHGQIRAIDVTADIDYGRNRVLRFEKQILTTNMSSGGDSGSLVLDSENRAVGLVFAGSESSTLVNPIRTVLQLLNVRF